MALKCRFYERKYPTVDEMVMVKVRSITDKLAHVDLLQYDDLQGIVLLSEVSRRRIRSLNKLLRIGSNQCLVVIKVDESKGFVDLSKRRISSPKEINACEKSFARGKAVASLLRRVGSMLDYDKDDQLEELMRKTAWYFDEKYKHLDGAYGAFKRAALDPTIIDECELDEHAKEVLLSNIVSRIASRTAKVRSCIEVSCFTYEGIDAVKYALREGLKLSTDEFPLSITLLASPLYDVTTTTFDPEGGLEHIQDVVDAVRKAIEERDGRFALKIKPTVEMEAEDEAECEDDSGNYSGEDDFGSNEAEPKNPSHEEIEGGEQSTS